MRHLAPVALTAVLVLTSTVTAQADDPSPLPSPASSDPTTATSDTPSPTVPADAATTPTPVSPAPAAPDASATPATAPDDPATSPTPTATTSPSPTTDGAASSPATARDNGEPDRLALLHDAVATAVGDDLLPRRDGGFCPRDLVEPIFEPVPASSIHLGGFVEPLRRPDPTTGTRATGIVTCDGAAWAVAGFDARWSDGSWTVFVHPVDLTREEVHVAGHEHASGQASTDSDHLHDAPRKSDGSEGATSAATNDDTAGAAAAGSPPVPQWPAGISHTPPPLSKSDPQDQCLNRIQPGTRALAELLVATYPAHDYWSSLRGCNVGGRSEHKEGRALDWMLDANDASERRVGNRLTRWMVAPDPWGNAYGPARHLGVMYIIWNRQAWYQFWADDGWRDYTGASPHTDHVHFSLTWPGARCETTWWEATNCQGAPSGNGNVVDRVAGSNRIATAVDLSRDAFKRADTVVVASGSNYPDALAAGSLAAAVDGPLLLTGPDRLPDRVVREIRRLEASTIYLAGGRAAVSKAVQDRLAQLGKVQRLAGPDRVATAARIARKVENLTNSNRVLVVRMDNYADALSAINIAGATGAPIVLTGSRRLPPVTRRAITDMDPAKGWVVGGTEAISNRVWSGVHDAVGGSVHRVSGSDRYATSVDAARVAELNGGDVAPAVISSGGNYPDALAAGPAAIEHGGQLLLVHPNRVRRSRTVLRALEDDADNIRRAVIAGGAQAVAPAWDPALLSAIGG